jgi:hypothetical protein
MRKSTRYLSFGLCAGAHQEQNAVRAAYNRAEYLNERRAMMKRWADHLDAIAGDNIVSYKSKIGMES